MALTGEAFDRISDGRGRLLHLVLERTGRIDDLSLNLLGLTLHLHLLVTGEGTGGSLQTALGIFGGSLDFVFKSNGNSAMEWQGNEEQKHTCALPTS